MDISARHCTWGTTLLRRCSAQERRRVLTHEIAGYQTHADREDLLAAIRRCDSPGAEEIRSLLLRVAADADSTALHLRS